MLQVKNPKLAFAIKYNENPNKNVAAKDGLFDLMNYISEQYPTAKFEGITSPKRVSKKKYEPIVEFGGLALTKVKVEKRNIICIGVSKKYDVSFEKEDDISIGIGCGLRLGSIPVLDIEDDAQEIIKRLAAYFAEEYPLTSILRHAGLGAPRKTCCQPKQVKFHSSYVEVDGRAISYEVYHSMQQPKVKVTQKVTTSGAPSLQGMLAALLK